MSLSELFNFSDHGKDWGDIQRVIVSLSEFFNFQTMAGTGVIFKELLCLYWSYLIFRPWQELG